MAIYFSKLKDEINAYNSPAVQQAIMQDIAKFTDAEVEFVPALYGTSITIKLKGIKDIFDLPPQDIMCDVSYLIFRRNIRYVCPDYNNAEVTFTVYYSTPMPEDFKQVLHMLGKIEYSYSPSYSHAHIVCKR